ncbi:hypothetical protein ACVW1C_000159 [Bradyrhizobium sp. USDA 4011]
MKAIDPIMLAWAAGIIEGEGSIYSNVRTQLPTRGRNMHHRVRVVMSDRDVVTRLRDVFDIGRVVPYSNTQGLGKKQLYRWEAARRADVVAVCDEIYPFMGERRRAQIDRLRALLLANPAVPAAERVRRTWISRQATAARSWEAETGISQ